MLCNIKCFSEDGEIYPKRKIIFYLKCRGSVAIDRRVIRKQSCFRDQKPDRL